VIPIDSGQMKKMQQRRRTRRRPLPEPSVPTFVMVKPGRYIRVEEPAPSSITTTEAADEVNWESRSLDLTEEIAVTAVVSITQVGNGCVNADVAVPSSAHADQVGGTGIEVPVVNEPTFDDEPVKGSEEEPGAGSRCAYGPRVWHRSLGHGSRPSSWRRMSSHAGAIRSATLGSKSTPQ
jgi:hypothetical protein